MTDTLTAPPPAQTLTREDCDFHMVWTKNGRVPRFRHNTQVDADKEAERLALLNPGRKFIVLHATHKVAAPADQVASTGEPDSMHAAAGRAGFKRGLACAIGWMLRYYSENDTPLSMLREVGYTVADLAQAGADEYDLEPIRAALREAA